MDVQLVERVKMTRWLIRYADMAAAEQDRGNFLCTSAVWQSTITMRNPTSCLEAVMMSLRVLCGEVNQLSYVGQNKCC